MPNTSKPSPSGWPCATRDTENVPTAPRPNRAVNTAASSLRTGPAWPVTSARPCPTVLAAGTGRSVTVVRTMAPLTTATGPHSCSAMSTR